MALKYFKLPHGELVVNAGDVTESIQDSSGNFIRLAPGKSHFFGTCGLDLYSYFMNQKFWDSKLAVDKVIEEKGEMNLLMRSEKVDKFGDQIMFTIIPAAYKETYEDKVNIDILIPECVKEIWENNTHIRNVFYNENEIKEEYDIDYSVNNLELKFDRKDKKSCSDIILENIQLHLVNKAPIFILSEEEKQWAKKELKDFERTKIGIQIKSAVASRTYPYMKELGELLHMKGYDVIILDSIKPNGKFQYSFRKMAAIANECDLIVTPDSAIFHLAGALKKRTVGIFGYTDGKIYSENYEKTSYVQAKCPHGKPPCWWSINCLPGKTHQEKTDQGYVDCLTQLTPENILGKIEEQFNEPKKVLVVMLTYNLLMMTKKAIASIRSFHDYELFVVDNESTDGTQEWLKENGIEFVSKKTSVAAAQNIGIQKFLEGQYDYFMLLNNDVVLRFDTIERLIEDSKRTGAWAVMSSEVPGAQPWTIDYTKSMSQRVEEIIDIPTGSYSCTLFTRECIEKTGFFDERYAPRYIEDNDYTLRMRLAGGKFYKSEAAIYWHYLGAVVKLNKKEKESGNEYWDRNIKLFIEKFGIHPHDHQDLNKLGLEWKRNVNVDEIEKALKDRGSVKILVERRMGGYGDILFTTVIARELKKKFGNKVTIIYRVPSDFHMLLDNNPNIDMIGEYGVRIHPDFKIDLTDLEFRVELQEMQQNGGILSARTEIYLNTIGLNGVNNLKPDYFLTDSERAWAEEQWKHTDKFRIAWAMKGSNKLKQWPYMRKLWDMFKGMDIVSYVIWGSDGVSEFSFRESAAIVATANLVISPDSGISNLAGALDVPVITIFSNRNKENFEKMFDTMVGIQGHCPFLEKDYCDFFCPCLGDGPHRSKEEKHIPECLNNLQPEEVFKEAKKIING
jgi:ADP-heptose:LPS heptosyltransferase/GT2 family glycosyltransferase